MAEIILTSLVGVVSNQRAVMQLLRDQVSIASDVKQDWYITPRIICSQIITRFDSGPHGPFGLAHFPWMSPMVALCKIGKLELDNLNPQTSNTRHPRD